MADREEVIARWTWVYDYDEDPPGGFVFGRFKLRSDGVLLRAYRDHGEDWKKVDWWPGETDLLRAMQLLHRRGYELKDGPNVHT
ncbi:hypothetical protein BJF79_01410 [Actinomadura sp. CNU-125]|uniref:hypothetical protein n=1 Tax=Actinomadura sp. CNU-125 TaxID=1904961 RepID=UPI000964DBBB|nr:hypothetical protein [Actinomadura sp. CNU-125]OLT27296.1 hypothetical protein BJF79_01410 [Actinomadura sp. CNU-125]